jgi:hypothetical protein
MPNMNDTGLDGGREKDANPEIDFEGGFPVFYYYLGTHGRFELFRICRDKNGKGYHCVPVTDLQEIKDMAVNLCRTKYRDFRAAVEIARAWVNEYRPEIKRAFDEKFIAKDVKQAASRIKPEEKNSG